MAAKKSPKPKRSLAWGVYLEGELLAAFSGRMAAREFKQEWEGSKVLRVAIVPQK